MLTPSDIAALLRHPAALFASDCAEEIRAAFGADVVTRVETEERPRVDEATGLPLNDGPRDAYRLNPSRAHAALARLIGLVGEVESPAPGLIALGTFPAVLGRLKGRKIYLTAQAARPDVEPAAIVLTVSETCDPRETHLVRFSEAFLRETRALRFRPEVIDARLPTPASSQKGSPRAKRISDRKLCETVLDWLLAGLSDHQSLDALRTQLKTQRRLAKVLGISEGELSRRIGKDSPPSLFKGLVEIFRDPQLWTLFESWAKSQPTPAEKRRSFLLNLTPHQLHGLCAHPPQKGM